MWGRWIIVFIWGTLLCFFCWFGDGHQQLCWASSLKIAYHFGFKARGSNFADFWGFSAGDKLGIRCKCGGRTLENSGVYMIWNLWEFSDFLVRFFVIWLGGIMWLWRFMTVLYDDQVYCDLWQRYLWQCFDIFWWLFRLTVIGQFLTRWLWQLVTGRQGQICDSFW